MSLVLLNPWFRRAASIAVIALGSGTLAIPVKPAGAALVGVGVGLPGYYPPVPGCTYPYGCYGYAAPYNAPAGAVVGGWGWGGWGGPWWQDGRVFRDGRFFHRDGRFFAHDGRFFLRDGRFFHRDGRFVHDGRFFHGGFGGPGFAHGGFGGPGFMHGGFGGAARTHGGFGGAGFAHGGFGGRH